jgi:hypothetical protein
VLRSGDIFIYFQSSHGGNSRTRPRDAFLCSHNANYTDRELASDLARFNRGVKIVVIIDACHSGGMFKSADGGWNFAENVMQAYEQEVAKAHPGLAKSALAKFTSNIGFMTAADYHQTSQGGRPNSIYAGYVLQAMRTSSADNAPRNSVISSWEAHAWAKPRASRANRSQTAQHLNGTLLKRTPLCRLSTRLSAPVPIGPTGTTVARPLFSWRTVTGARSYQLQVYNSSGRLIISRTGLTGSTWRPSSNLSNGNYRWRVRAASGTTYSSWSAFLNFTVGPAGAFLRRATLTWGAQPRDLDSHLVTPTLAHVYFRARGSQTTAPYAQLDVDDVSSYGPENISIYRYVSSGGRSYKYYVHNWSGERNLAGCGARVSVQSRTGVLRNFLVPSSGTGRYWHVFNMSANGSVTSVNRIRTSAP